MKIANIVSYLLSLTALILIFKNVRLQSYLTLFIAIEIYAVMTGLILGLVSFFHKYQKNFVTASFFAGITILTPLVIVTYGFALLAVPAIILWCLTIISTSKLASRIAK